MSWSKSLRLLLVLVAAGCLSLPASAGTIRDDRDDSLYLNFGARQNYASVGQFVGTVNLLSRTTGEWEPWAFSASGTLIEPDYVLTAAHVLWPAGYQDSEYSDADLLSLNFYPNGQISGEQPIPAKAWKAHEQFDWNVFSGYDIGLVKLDEKIDDIRPARRYSGKREVGPVGTFVGFGVTGTGLTGANLDVAFNELQKRAGMNSIDALASSVYYGASENILLCDFDNPNDPSDSLLGRSKPLGLEYLPSFGDSGGGLFIGGRLAGVQSIGIFVEPGDPPTFSDYGDLAGSTRVSVFNDWIDPLLEEGLEGVDDVSDFDGEPGGRSSAASDTAFTDLNVTAVPEPSSLWLLLVGGSCLIACRLRKGKR